MSTSTHRLVSTSLSRDLLVDYSKARATQGKRRFLLQQAKKDLDRHIKLMENRIHRLRAEETESIKTREAQQDREKSLKKVRETNRSLKRVVRDSKEEAKRHISELHERNKKVREENKKKLVEARRKSLAKKQESRLQVRAESSENQRIIKKIEDTQRILKKQCAQSILSYEQSKRRKRMDNTREFVKEINRNFNAKCSKEAKDAQNAKEKLVALTDHEETLMNSFRLTSELSFVKCLKDDELFASQVVRINKI